MRMIELVETLSQTVIPIGGIAERKAPIPYAICRGGDLIHSFAQLLQMEFGRRKRLALEGNVVKPQASSRSTISPRRVPRDGKCNLIAPKLQCIRALRFCARGY